MHPQTRAARPPRRFAINILTEYINKYMKRYEQLRDTQFFFLLNLADLFSLSLLLSANRF